MVFTMAAESEAYFRKIALAVAYQQACLPAAAISYNDKLLGESWWLCNICSGRFPTD
jgi:hypothetical protein